MSLKKQAILIFCAACLLVSSCTAKSGVTASGSDEWSRGVILSTTGADLVAVAAWRG